MTQAPHRPELALTRRIVIKIGTRVLTHDTGRIALTRFFHIVESAAALRAEGREVLLVSSGAVGLGAEALSLTAIPSVLAERQACAAVGQSRLMALYQEGFAHFRLACAQLLLTQADFENRERYLNLRNTLEELLRRRVVPVINENDAVSVAELAYLDTRLGDAAVGEAPFGDNDQLSALVAGKLDADLLVLLTDVSGVHVEDPRSAAGSPILDTLPASEIETIAAGGSGSTAGRGGMRSKLRAAATAAEAGCHAVIASGRTPNALLGVASGAQVGTWIPARAGLPARRRWLAHAAAVNGILVLDVGAVDALLKRNASLLPAGVTRVVGDFERGAIVELHTPRGVCIGRGAVHCGADEARAWCAGTPPAGARNRHALVDRADMVLERQFLERPALERDLERPSPERPSPEKPSPEDGS